MAGTRPLTIGGGTNGAVYDVFRTTAIGADSLTNWPWVWLTNAYACDTVTVSNEPDGAFYILGTPLDSDSDGLTDAFELLISHSDPTTGYTRGDGISDLTAYLQGRNPRVPGSVPDTNGVVNLQVYTPLN